MAPLRDSALILSYVAREHAGRIELVWVAPSASSLLGYQREDLLDPSWLESTLHPEHRESARALHARVIETRRRAVAEYRFRHADGSWRWFRGEVQSAGADPSSMVLALWSDVTPEHAARAALEAARRELEQCGHLRELAHLGAELTRELEHALTEIRARCTSLATEPETAPAREREQLDAIARSAATAAALTRRLHALHDPAEDAARSAERLRRP